MEILGSTQDIQNLFSEFDIIRGIESKPSKPSEILGSENQFHEIDLFTCPYCHESTLREEEGMLVCSNRKCARECGNVITTKQEWRNHSESGKSDPSRCGMPVHPLLPQASLGTVAQGYGKQGYRRLQMQNAMPSNERALLDAIKLIKSAALKLKIPATLADKACYLYAELTKGMKIKRGPVRKALMANCQYSICKRKDSGCYVCVEQLSNGYDIEMKKYNEGAKLFIQLSYHKTHGRANKSNWGHNFSNSRKTFVKPTSPEDITEDACRKLKLTDFQTGEVTYIVRQVARLKLVSARMPQSIAAGCLILYVTTKKLKRITVSHISKICTVSNATAKNTYNELKIGKSFLLPKVTNDLRSGKVGNCMPRVRLEKIYKAPRRAIPKTVYLGSDKISVKKLA